MIMDCPIYPNVIRKVPIKILVGCEGSNVEDNVTTEQREKRKGYVLQRHQPRYEGVWKRQGKKIISQNL